MDDDGNVSYEPRRDPKHRKLIAKQMTGKPFSVRVRDNGLDFEVFLLQCAACCDEGPMFGSVGCCAATELNTPKIHNLASKGALRYRRARCFISVRAIALCAPTYRRSR